MEFLDFDLDLLNLPPEVISSLKTKFTYLGELCNAEKGEIMSINGIWKFGVNHVEEALEEFGLHLHLKTQMWVPPNRRQNVENQGSGEASRLCQVYEIGITENINLIERAIRQTNSLDDAVRWLLENQKLEQLRTDNLKKKEQQEGIYAAGNRNRKGNQSSLEKQQGLKKKANVEGEKEIEAAWNPGRIVAENRKNEVKFINGRGKDQQQPPQHHKQRGNKPPYKQNNNNNNNNLPYKRQQQQNSQPSRNNNKNNNNNNNNGGNNNKNLKKKEAQISRSRDERKEKGKDQEKQKKRNKQKKKQQQQLQGEKNYEQLSSQQQQRQNNSNRPKKPPLRQNNSDYLKTLERLSNQATNSNHSSNEQHHSERAPSPTFSQYSVQTTASARIQRDYLEWEPIVSPNPFPEKTSIDNNGMNDRAASNHHHLNQQNPQPTHHYQQKQLSTQNQHHSTTSSQQNKQTTTEMIQQQNQQKIISPPPKTTTTTTTDLNSTTTTTTTTDINTMNLHTNIIYNKANPLNDLLGEGNNSRSNLEWSDVLGDMNGSRDGVITDQNGLEGEKVILDGKFKTHTNNKNNEHLNNVRSVQTKKTLPLIKQQQQQLNHTKQQQQQNNLKNHQIKHNVVDTFSPENANWDDVEEPVVEKDEWDDVVEQITRNPWNTVVEDQNDQETPRSAEVVDGDSNLKKKPNCTFIWQHQKSENDEPTFPSFLTLPQPQTDPEEFAPLENDPKPFPFLKMNKRDTTGQNMLEAEDNSDSSSKKASGEEQPNMKTGKRPPLPRSPPYPHQSFFSEHFANLHNNASASSNSSTADLQNSFEPRQPFNTSPRYDLPYPDARESPGARSRVVGDPIGSGRSSGNGSHKSSSDTNTSLASIPPNHISGRKLPSPIGPSSSKLSQKSSSLSLDRPRSANSIPDFRNQSEMDLYRRNGGILRPGSGSSMPEFGQSYRSSYNSYPPQQQQQQQPSHHGYPPHPNSPQHHHHHHTHHHMPQPFPSSPSSPHHPSPRSMHYSQHHHSSSPTSPPNHRHAYPPYGPQPTSPYHPPHHMSQPRHPRYPPHQQHPYHVNEPLPPQQYQYSSPNYSPVEPPPNFYHSPTRGPVNGFHIGGAMQDNFPPFFVTPSPPPPHERIPYGEEDMSYHNMRSEDYYHYQQQQQQQQQQNQRGYGQPPPPLPSESYTKQTTSKKSSRGKDNKNHRKGGGSSSATAASVMNSILPLGNTSNNGSNLSLSDKVSSVSGGESSGGIQNKIQKGLKFDKPAVSTKASSIGEGEGTTTEGEVIKKKKNGPSTPISTLLTSLSAAVTKSPKNATAKKFFVSPKGSSGGDSELNSDQMLFWQKLTQTSSNSTTTPTGGADSITTTTKGGRIAFEEMLDITNGKKTNSNVDQINVGNNVKQNKNNSNNDAKLNGTGLPNNLLSINNSPSSSTTSLKNDTNGKINNENGSVVTSKKKGMYANLESHGRNTKEQSAALSSIVQTAPLAPSEQMLFPPTMNSQPSFEEMQHQISLIQKKHLEKVKMKQQSQFQQLREEIAARPSNRKKNRTMNSVNGSKKIGDLDHQDGEQEDHENLAMDSKGSSSPSLTPPRYQHARPASPMNPYEVGGELDPQPLPPSVHQYQERLSEVESFPISRYYSGSLGGDTGRGIPPPPTHSSRGSDHSQWTDVVEKQRSEWSNVIGPGDHRDLRGGHDVRGGIRNATDFEDRRMHSGGYGHGLEHLNLSESQMGNHVEDRAHVDERLADASSALFKKLLKHSKQQLRNSEKKDPTLIPVRDSEQKVMSIPKKESGMNMKFKFNLLNMNQSTTVDHQNQKDNLNAHTQNKMNQGSALYANEGQIAEQNDSPGWEPIGSNNVNEMTMNKTNNNKSKPMGINREENIIILSKNNVHKHFGTSAAGGPSTNKNSVPGGTGLGSSGIGNDYRNYVLDDDFEFAQQLFLNSTSHANMNVTQPGIVNDRNEDLSKTMMDGPDNDSGSGGEHNNLISKGKGEKPQRKLEFPNLSGIPYDDDFFDKLNRNTNNKRLIKKKKKGQQGPRKNLDPEETYESIRDQYRKRIEWLFHSYEDDKLDRLDNLLDQYEGIEHKLYVKLCQRYGEKPSKKVTRERLWKPKRGPPIIVGPVKRIESTADFVKHPGLKDYDDRLKCITLAKDGKLTSKEIGEKIGRSQKFVTKWWKKHPAQVPKPKNLKFYDYQNYRDLIFQRKFINLPTLYDLCLNAFEWRQSRVVKTDRKTGKKEATNRWAPRQVAEYVPNVVPELDEVILLMCNKYNIPSNYHCILNWYVDGRSWTGSHRHDCWTALLSIGADRVLRVDRTDVLMEDGDVIVFGTQKHGVPMMTDCNGGRISVVLFYKPGGMQEAWNFETEPQEED